MNFISMVQRQNDAYTHRQIHAVVYRYLDLFAVPPPERAAKQQRNHSGFKKILTVAIPLGTVILAYI